MKAPNWKLSVPLLTQTRDAYLGATSGLQHAHHKGVGSFHGEALPSGLTPIQPLYPHNLRVPK